MSVSGLFRGSQSRFSFLWVVLAGSRLSSRRLLHNAVSRFAGRPFIFAIAAIAVLAAKSVHVYAHHTALSASDILLWLLSFFAQDTVFLILLRILLDDELCTTRRWIRGGATALATITSAVTYLLAAANISFFAAAGSEVHWRNIGFVGDKSSRKVLLSGLASSIAVGIVMVATSWLAQCYLYTLAGVAQELTVSLFIRAASILRYLPKKAVRYIHLPQLDPEEASDFDHKDEFGESNGGSPSAWTWPKIVMGVYLILQVVSIVIRPAESSLVFLSWTMILLPWVDFTNSSPSLAGLLPFYGNGINRQWDGRTALTKPIQFPWLPKNNPLAGFDDWYNSGNDHYNAAEDPLKISNLNDDLLPGIQQALSDIKIRHVVLVKLESTRKDVFPIKKNGYIWKRLASTFPDAKFPSKAEQRLATLTPNANFLTGDYEDGFVHTQKRRRGGINFNNAYTTATYTLKSMTGTLCGITPLVADFNVEYQYHIYQPCLPHIFDLFNTLNARETNTNVSSDFHSLKWRSSLIQSITDTYDKQDRQMSFLGYKPENFIYKEYLQSSDAKFGPVNLPEINYYGMAEVAVEDYIRDAFVLAKKDNERVFLTHFTSTTHHPFAIPEEEEYAKLSNDGLNDLSHYLNSIGYVDRWLGRILEILDEQMVANETLIIMAGDHGISVAENNGVTPYYNPNIGNFHVPLVISHPHLPNIDIDDAVESLQILPTILDLLLETGSLPDSQKQVAHDLVRNYEGQSLIRPLHKTSNGTAGPHAYWQFTVMNPGRATVAVRDARQPGWRLIVPIVQNVEWRFTDLGPDPHENEPTLAFDFFTCLRKVKSRYGVEAAKWAEEAAFMARWWVEENRKRYRYDSPFIQNN
ncbi:sulfatase domain-containingprotein [Purpureocillium lilacinum]|uniref:Sulfatase domain-containingprotein n=1 Tax=Purpureocillium lilacinum TaxID=33203 RepID=A0A179FB15_PURLI|nr:sulfatase domain-containingprotein [Purpureocillium lilacinum]OAQ62607.1 sulfatase domain-containingprotein [Purpureocillium lilacinum]